METSRSVAFRTRVGLGMLALLVASWGQTSHANPNFARKYKFDCSTCHTVPPQLTRVGIEFRRLGYRFPNELNQKGPKLLAAHGEAAGAKSSPAISTMTAAGCGSCHAIEPGQAGVGLEGVGAKMNADQVRSYIRSETHPGAEAGKALSDDGLAAIVEYLATLTVPPGKDPWLYDFANFLSTRGRTRYVVQKVSKQTARNEIKFNDMTFYYLGPINPYLTTFFETEFEEGFAPNVLAQGTLIYGNPDQYAYLKVGNMRLVRQGVASLDRPKSISTDLAAGGKAHLFALNTDQRGVEAGYAFNKNRTVVRGFVMNGIDNTGNGRPTGRQDLNSQKDIAIIVENLFGERTTSALSALAYSGRTPTDSGGNISFYRLGLFGALALNNAANAEDIRLSGTALYGSDDLPGPGAREKNLGFAAALDKRLGKQFYASVRYDQFRPTDKATKNTTKSYTVSLMKQVLTYLRLTAEYQLIQRPGKIDDNRATVEYYLFF
ncbi:MAG: hypothetical protein HY304_07050 [candidate division Zixibacteria bacterium]|nr:hypothetical protein [candidate division Zixibacteria bacterium]